MILKDWQRLAEVDVPIAGVSKDAVREIRFVMLTPLNAKLV